MSYYIAKDHFGNYDLVHAQEWKQHKYIRKEGNRYIYPEDLRQKQVQKDASSLRGIANLAKTPLQETKNARPNSSNRQSINNAINPQKMKKDLPKAKEQLIRDLQTGRYAVNNPSSPNGKKMHALLNNIDRQAEREKNDPNNDAHINYLGTAARIAGIRFKEAKNNEFIANGVPASKAAISETSEKAAMDVVRKKSEKNGRNPKEAELERILRSKRVGNENRFDEKDIEIILNEYRQIKDPTEADNYIEWYRQMYTLPKTRANLGKNVRQALNNYAEKEREKRNLQSRR